MLGIGTGFRGGGRSSNQVKMGQAAFTKLLRHAIDRGIRYIDTADIYGSHIFLREALKSVDRGKLFIQTKTRPATPKSPRPTSSDSARSWAWTAWTRC